MNRILGITAEYDPFHNGHKYHLDTAKATVCPDATVCVMSGDITQRGELAVLDKWKRAMIAADQGVDLVLELPFLYACSPAPGFASGAVDILVSAGVTHISFGCETEDHEKLTELARMQITEAERIEKLAREEMKGGLSHVKARQRASEKILGKELTWLSLSPNNILALEYLKRMMFWREKGRKIEAIPILRKGSGYKEVGEMSSQPGTREDANSKANTPATPEMGASDVFKIGASGTTFSKYAKIIASSEAGEATPKMAGGSAIRTMIEAGWDVSDFLPYDFGGQSRFAQWVDLKKAGDEILKQLRGALLRTDVRQLSTIRFVGEGIENKLIREAAEAKSYKDLLKRMTSRRYTTSTIRRMIICILMGVITEVKMSTEPDEDLGSPSGSNARCADEPYPADPLYGRILAISHAGRALVASEPELPFIANVNKIDNLPEAALRSIDLDIRAADLYNLLTGRDPYKYSDHRQKPYIK